LVEAGNGVQHLVVVEDLTAEKIAGARRRPSSADGRVTEVDNEVLCV
jgi:hypothetical protein